MRPDCISQMSQSPMLSKLNSPSSEGEAEEEEEITKKEGSVIEILIPMEDTDNNNRINTSKHTDNKIIIRFFSLKEAEGEDQMRNQAYNVITEKSMGTMNLNVGRSKKISSREEKMCQIIREKTQEVCFSHATRLKNNLKISGCWIVDAEIT
jgi:hypothetical protein